jgi:hypothetical protein
MRDVVLSPGIPGGKWARLRSLRGRDEFLIDASGTADCITFLDRLLTEAAGTTVKPGCTADLAVCDCDRLCAAIYMEYFGDRIEGRMSCDNCFEAFDMTFSLQTLMQNLTERSQEISLPDPQGFFTSVDGRRFRLPTIAEQQTVAGLGTDAAIAALVSRCVLDNDSAEALDSVEKSMEQAGPILSVDLDAACPHCGATQIVRFDMQSYLFRALGHEKQFLLYEVHRIATAYGWTCEETLDLTREERRKFVQLIESERGARRRTRPWKDI